jgi:hypothetical protein
MRTEPNPDTILRQIARRAAEAAVPSRPPADASAVLDSARRGSGNADVGDPTTGDLQLLEARRELQATHARLKHLEQALCCAAKVLAPYVNGRS